MHGGIFARAGRGEIQVASRFAELIPLLKELGERQMGEGLVRSQGDELFQKTLRHGWIAQFPVGMGEIEMNRWALAVQQRGFLEGIDRG